MDLTTPPSHLTRNQRLLFALAALIAAASRFLAMSRSLWDWDEALFCLGMRSYDVTSHHPHPPGFPVYIALAHIARLFTPSDFRALQSLNLIAGVLLFPAMFLLARELRLRFETALIASLLLVFFPNVWFFGGGAFSDIPSLTLVVFAVAMLLRGCRDAEAYLVGSFVLALAIGIRPQNILVGLVPGAIATWYRIRSSWRDVVFAALLGVTVVVLSFGSAAMATGDIDRYVRSIQEHSDYIARIDSFRAPERPPLWRLFDRFFFKQYSSPALSVLVTVFVLISTIGAIRKHDARIGMIALTFMPFAIAAWLMLDRFSVTRFSIGYMPLFAVMAADGIERAIGRRGQDLALAAGLTLVVAFIVYTLPALTPVRTEISPPFAAVAAAKQHLDPSKDQLFVAFNMTPFVQYLAPTLPFTQVMDDRAMPLSYGGRRPWLLAEDESTPRSGYVFRRVRPRLWNIARRHYFECGVEPMIHLPLFASGWYGAERGGIEEWRWMGKRSVTELPPATGLTKLRLQFDVPEVPMHPTVTVTLNGVVLGHIVVDGPHMKRDYKVAPAPNGANNVLVLETSRTLSPAQQHVGDDPRELGLQLRFLSWGPD
jgi:hypothetical protein